MPGMERLVRIRLERGIAHITLDSPSNRNALSRRLLAELHEALDTAERAHARAVVLGHDGGTFCSGADLKERLEGPVDSTPMVTALQRLSDMPIPTIAAVNGAVRAGGIGLMAACDLVVVASATTFAFTEVRIGVAPAIIAVPILARVSASFVAAAFLTGAPFDALEARAMGLVTHVADDVDGTVAILIEGLLLGAPSAVAAAKEILRRVPTLDRETAYAEMQRRSEAMFETSDAFEGMAAFRERRSPLWQVATVGESTDAVGRGEVE